LGLIFPANIKEFLGNQRLFPFKMLRFAEGASELLNVEMVKYPQKGQ